MKVSKDNKTHKTREEVPGYFPNHNKNTNIIKQTIFENVHEDIINPINKEKKKKMMTTLYHWLHLHHLNKY